VKIAIHCIALIATALAGAAAAQPVAPLLPIALDGDVARGSDLAQTCAGCHGIPGSRNAYPTYRVPKLGAQNADYLEIALQGYRRGTRGHPTMQAQAASLTDQDIADLAAYFVSREGEPEAGKSAAGALAVEAGRRKAVACLQCHGEAGIAAAVQWPHLAGQHESYLTQSLLQYRDGSRSDLLMGPLVAGLDDQTIAELAAYFAAQPWLHTVEQ
jgi:cytochrome c553